MSVKLFEMLRDVSEMTDGLAFLKLSGLIFMGKVRCSVGDSTKSDLAAKQNVPNILTIIDLSSVTP